MEFSLQAIQDTTLEPAGQAPAETATGPKKTSTSMAIPAANIVPDVIPPSISTLTALISVLITEFTIFEFPLSGGGACWSPQICS